MVERSPLGARSVKGAFPNFFPLPFRTPATLLSLRIVPFNITFNRLENHDHGGSVVERSPLGARSVKGAFPNFFPLPFRTPATQTTSASDSQSGRDPG